MRPIIVSVLFVLPCVVGAAGCGASCEDYCQAYEDCEGGDELEECKEECADEEEYAEKKDCADEFDEYLNCVDDEAVCEDEDYDESACDSEWESYYDCLPNDDDEEI